ncbi:unnamed protein product, partial [Rotaria sp. Silwood2]
IDNFLEAKTQLSSQLNKLYRHSANRPHVEQQCPDLLKVIEDTDTVDGASDDRRHSETIHLHLTLNDLRQKLNNMAIMLNQQHSFIYAR